MEKLDKNFTDFLKLLNRHGVDYLIVGGYAVGYHGFVRATGDLDIFVRISEENANALLKCFKEFGFSRTELRSEVFLEPGKIVRIGIPPLRIEVINQISGVTFDECFRKKVTARIGTLKTSFIGLESLLKNKKASGRLKDLADIEALRPKRLKRRR
jgi:hypothetical protein